MEKEIFKDIPGYEGIYQVSDLGRIKSLYRISSQNKVINEKILKPGLNANKYHHVILSKEGVRSTLKVHQLVTMVFLNHKRFSYDLVVNHKNFIRTDNRIENLEIVTIRENSNRKHLKSTSKYTGVSWYKRNKKWASHIKINDKQTFLGYFNNEHDAHLAYQKQLKKIV